MPAPAYEAKMAPMTSHSDFFLKLGDIKGESLDDKHKGEIDLMTFRFNVRQPGGSGNAKATITLPAQAVPPPA